MNYKNGPKYLNIIQIFVVIFWSIVQNSKKNALYSTW